MTHTVYSYHPERGWETHHCKSETAAIYLASQLAAEGALRVDIVTVDQPVIATVTQRIPE